MAAISTYRRRILEKQRLSSNVALVRYCLAHNFLSSWQRARPC